MAKIPTECFPCLKISATSLLRSPEGQEWLKSGKVATWATDPQAGYHDAFTLYDAGEGYNFEDCPPAIWALIEQEVKARGLTFAVIWLADIES